MRKRVRFTVQLESPLAISTKRQANAPETLTSIPGSTLRGGLLTAHRRVHGEDPPFMRLLEGGRNVFPFLYPGGAGALPIPLSWLSCKRKGAEHPLGDLLLPRAKARLGEKGDKAKATAELQGAHTCPECGNDRKPLAGYRTEGALSPSPVRTRRMNVGISRATGTAEPHILFGHEAVEPWMKDAAGSWVKTVFFGDGILHEDDRKVISHLTKEPLLLGRRRSRGYGRAKLEIQVLRKEDRKQAMKEVSRQITRYLSGKGKKEAPSQSEEVFFTLDLKTPLIAYDDYLRSVLDPESWMPEALDAEIVDCLIKPKIVSGWDMGVGMPRDDAYAVAEGSVVLAKSRKDLDELAQALEEVELNGLGERVEEGFGRVLVNDPSRLKMMR